MKANQPPAMIYQINLSDGGVPKTPVQHAELTPQGLVGDRQDDLRYHGGPARAVCLYSLEALEALQAEGHPIFPGALGENLTIRGLDWPALAPGVRLQLGTAGVEIEITSYAMPCNNLTPYFKDGKFSRVSQKLHPGWSRAYARVLQPGLLAVGDVVNVKNEL